jgi:hypothetical protein
MITADYFAVDFSCVFLAQDVPVNEALALRRAVLAKRPATNAHTPKFLGISNDVAMRANREDIGFAVEKQFFGISCLLGFLERRVTGREIEKHSPDLS